MQSSGTVDKIRVEHLTKTFPGPQGPVEALHDVNLVIPRGEFCCVVGPSGCGKTTLLRILAGLERPTAGGAEFDHEDRQRPLASMVFQEQSVFPWMTVEQNIGYGLRMRGVNRRTTREIVDYYLDKTGLTRFARAFPYQLSGGMKQRVSVARAFANDPEVLLMDEPFANLDEQNKVLLQEELLRIWEESRKTVIFITHSVDEALVLGDRVVVFTAHPGRVKAVLPVSFPRPRAVFELKAEAEFGQLTYRLWALLRDEVMAARGVAGVPIG
jgi:NitT/TauT family transport system ATP-binding protein